MITLIEFYIGYVDCKATKGKIIADQLIDVPILAYYLLSKSLDDSIFTLISLVGWKMYFYKLGFQCSSGVGILFVTPYTQGLQYIVRVPIKLQSTRL